MNKQQRLDWMPRRIVEDMAAACGEDPNGDREALVIAYQMSVGLSADGWPGKDTAQSLYGSGVAIPRNRQAVERAFGPMPWRKTGRGRGIKWTAAAPDIDSMILHNGAKLRVWSPLVGEVAALFAIACEASGYTPKSVASYVPRVIGGTDRLSFHSYGIAIDFDPTKNPWGGVQKNGKPSMMRQRPMFHEVFEWAGWSWGGRWEDGKGDDMHIERKS